MKKMRWFLNPILSLAILVGVWGLAGCGPEGAGSAPKLKGSKDDIQKSTQSGVPGGKTGGGKR